MEHADGPRARLFEDVDVAVFLADKNIAADISLWRSKRPNHLPLRVGPHQRIGFPQHRIADALKDIPRAQWGMQENNGFDFARILFPNVSVFIAPEITQVAQIFPGPTPGRNRTVLNYLRREPIRDEADRAATEAAINFFRDVTYNEDYLIGLEIQKGLESGAHEELLFGCNEPGNQYFHEWLDWYLRDDTDMPEPLL